MHDINNLVLVWFENNVVGLPNLLHQTECLSQRLLNVRLHFDMKRLATLVRFNYVWCPFVQSHE